MRLLFSLLIILLFTPNAFAQKKEISEARTQIKNKSNLAQAEASMRELLKDSANRGNIKIYVTLADAVRAAYDVANEQFYLKQSSDTASLFKAARKMFLAYELLDSAEMRPDAKGRVKLNYRKKNSENLASYRPNLYAGGLYFVGKGAYADAYDMLDTYLQCSTQPLFTSQKYDINDVKSQTAAFWTVFSGFKLNNPTKALTYKDIALGSKEYRERTQIYLAETYQLMNDTTAYVDMLSKGFEEHPSSQFFFTRIIDHYNDLGRFDTALDIADKAVKSDPSNSLFLFGKSSALLNLGRYNECLVVCDTLIARGDAQAEVYFNAGVSYVNMAVLLEKELKTDAKTKNKIKSYYKMAQPYMEKFRQMAPDQQDRWAPSLYNIYLKLNMGRQFEEINDLLKKSGK